MTILFFVRLFYPHIGGVEKHVLEISKILAQNGYKIKIITEKYDNNLENYEKIKDIEIYRIDTLSHSKFKKIRIWIELLKKIDLVREADIIHCHDVFFWYLPFRFAFFKKPVFTTFHGYEGNFPVSPKAIRARKIAEKLSVGNITVGNFIEKWYGTKSDYITYGGTVSWDKKRGNEARYKNRRFTILFVGRLEKDTGIPIYLSTLNKLKNNGISFNFVAAGEGSLKKQVEKHGRTLGFIKDVSEEMKKADIVFASSYLTILEALSVKKPVFSVWDNPLKKDYLLLSPFSRYITVVRDAGELAEKVAEFKYNEEKAEKAAIWANKQTWEKVAELYLKLWAKAR